MHQPNSSVGGIQNPVIQTHPGVGMVFQGGKFSGVNQPIKHIHRAFMGLGITQMVIGSICFVLGVVSVYPTFLSISIICYGIWGGVLFFISGLLALVAGSTSGRHSLVIATMVMNIIAALASAFVFCFGIPQAMMPRYYSNSQEANDLKKYDIVIGSFFAIFGFIEVILSITCSALCCKVHCCCVKSYNVAIIPGYRENMAYENSGQVIRPHPNSQSTSSQHFHPC